MSAIELPITEVFIARCLMMVGGVTIDAVCATDERGRWWLLPNLVWKAEDPRHPAGPKKATHRYDPEKMAERVADKGKIDLGFWFTHPGLESVAVSYRKVKNDVE